MAEEKDTTKKVSKNQPVSAETNVSKKKEETVESTNQDGKQTTITIPVREPRIKMCPKHNTPMRDGFCKLCQQEYYDQNFRRYWKYKDDDPHEKKTTQKPKSDNKKSQKPKKGNSQNRPINNNDLQALMDKFNGKHI